MTASQIVEAPVLLLRDDMLSAKAKFLWLYLKSHAGEDGKAVRLNQPHLCKVIGSGVNAKDLRDAVRNLEDQGWLSVDRSRKPHAYTPKQGENL